MDELLFLRRFSQYENDMDVSSFQAQLSSNWFSKQNAQEVYELFLSLDLSGSGMLSREELRRFTGGRRCNRSIQLTSAAVDRIFEEYITYHPAEEMDFKTFLDLIIALELMDTRSALHYFFRVLDVTHCDKITPMAITYFYSDVQKGLSGTGWDSPSVADIRQEIFDMAGVNDITGITLADLDKCGQGSTICAMLLDVTGFWEYDNRESLMAMQVK